MGSNNAFALFTTLARACSSPTVRNCGRRSVLLAVPRRDCRQGLARAEIQPGHQTRTEARDSGCYPGVRFCAPLGEGQGQVCEPHGKAPGGGGGGGSTISGTLLLARQMTLKNEALVTSQPATQTKTAC